MSICPIIAELALLLQDSSKRMAKMDESWKDAADFLADFSQKRLKPIYGRGERASKDRFTLCLVGLTNVGKSTLTQMLLGHNIAPRKNGPATAIPVEYEYRNTWSVHSLSPANQTVEDRRFDKAKDVGDFLRYIAMEAPPEQTQTIIVRGPIAMLKDTNLVFADTPGFGAAQLDAAKGTHEEKLVQYLKNRVDEIYFCVSGADTLLKKAEAVFFNQIADFCSTIVVNKWETTPGREQQEIHEYKARIAHAFPLRHFIFTEAKDALMAVRDDDTEMFRRSGLSISGRPGILGTGSNVKTFVL